MSRGNPERPIELTPNSNKRIIPKQMGEVLLLTPTKNTPLRPQYKGGKPLDTIPSVHLSMSNFTFFGTLTFHKKENVEVPWEGGGEQREGK